MYKGSDNREGQAANPGIAWVLDVRCYAAKERRSALALALLLLCLSGIAAGFVIDRLYKAEAQVHHTYDVEVAIGDVESSMTAVGRSRVAYIDSADPAIPARL